jgi:hypothetical protein
MLSPIGLRSLESNLGLVDELDVLPQCGVAAIAPVRDGEDLSNFFEVELLISPLGCHQI